MTNQTAPTVASEPPADVPAKKTPPLRILLTVLHLAALGVLGGGVIAIVATLLGLGLGLALVLGIGLLFVVGFVYAIYGVAWFEVARVRGLYDLDINDLRRRRRQSEGFGGWIRALGRQSVDGRMWRALANFAIACV